MVTRAAVPDRDGVGSSDVRGQLAGASSSVRRHEPLRLRVALVSFDYGEYCVPIASALAPEADVCLLLPRHEAAPMLGKLDPGVRLEPFDKPRLRQPGRQLATCATIVRRIHRFRPDVVHVQQGHLWFNLMLPLLRTYPLVVTIHDHSHHPGDRGARNTPQPILTLGFRLADELIIHSERLRREAIARRGLDPGSVHVVPHVLVGEGAPARPPARTPRPRVLFFGRMWPYKGLEYLIRAEPLVSAAVPDVEIVVAGAGEDLARYRRMMRHPERFVVRNEFVSNHERAELFAAADVVVLPYVEASQSGVVPIAYAFGKPVVATTVGGLPDVVDDGRTGYLVPPRDEVALAEAVVRLLQDPELARRLGRNGRAKIHAEASPGVVAQQTLAVYRRAVARRARPSRA